MLLFDSAHFRAELPGNATAFASGANRVSEILGFGKLNMPVGVSADELHPSAIGAIIGERQPVMVDSGAFSEVEETKQGLRVVAPISDTEWKRRLKIYLDIASVLHNRATVVAPDRVGDQEVTLERLDRYRSQLHEIASTGANILIPIQLGKLSLEAFYRAAVATAGVPLIPSLPMRKAVVTLDQIREFVSTIKPNRIHLLGIGPNNRRAPKVLRLIQIYSPSTVVSIDSNRMRAVLGEGQPLTIAEEEFRTSEIECLFGEVYSPAMEMMGRGLDYTDSISSPSEWTTKSQLNAIASDVGWDSTQRRAFLADPDEFLQSSMYEDEDIAWIESPVVSYALDRAWKDFVETTSLRFTRSAAIISVFGPGKTLEENACAA